MANLRVIERSFSGGELSPEMFGRIDDAKYQSGLATCRNFVVRPHGPAVNRSGTKYVRYVKDSTKRTRVIPFTFSPTQTFAIEIGVGYLRFHTMGATLQLAVNATAWADSTPYFVGDLVSNGGINYVCVVTHVSAAPFATDLGLGFWQALSGMVYEVATPYAEADIFDIHYVQSSDVMTFTHPNYPPHELRRYANDGNNNPHWVFNDISFAATVSQPSGITVNVTGFTVPKYTYYYTVTAVGADGISESSAGTPASDTGNLFETGCISTISWSAVTGATRYNVYKRQGGLYGYIGSTPGGTLSMVDDNIAPDMSRVPPVYEVVFDTTGKYPGAVSYYEQRRAFGGTITQPSNLWMTKSGTESNMSYSLPIKDDDRISVRAVARESNIIRHIVPLSQLILLTNSAEWKVTSVNSDAITPTSISIKPQSYIGSNNVQPSIVNNSLVYCAARGGHVRELGYNWQASGFITGDLSLRAIHLFDTFEIVDMCYSKAPQPVLWFSSNTGKLLGLTYVPEQQIGAWHQHDTDGVFESCTAVAEGGEDIVYVVVRRVINGSSYRFIERMNERVFTGIENAFFVDCGLTYSGAPTQTISGLDHLEGKTVNILADGAVHPSRVVVSGDVTLDIPASLVHVGLPIQSDVFTLPAAMQIDGAGGGRFKNVNKLWVRVDRASSIFAGPDVDHLVEQKRRTTEPYGSPAGLKSEEVEIVLTPSWGANGQVYVRHSAPLPISILALTLEVAIGG